MITSNFSVKLCPVKHRKFDIHAEKCSITEHLTFFFCPIIKWSDFQTAASPFPVQSTFPSFPPSLHEVIRRRLFFRRKKKKSRVFGLHRHSDRVSSEEWICEADRAAARAQVGSLFHGIYCCTQKKSETTVGKLTAIVCSIFFRQSASWQREIFLFLLSESVLSFAWLTRAGCESFTPWSMSGQLSNPLFDVFEGKRRLFSSISAVGLQVRVSAYRGRLSL